MGRIVFAIDTNGSGGAERVISVLANWFSAHDQEVTVVNSDRDSDFYKFNDNITVYKLDIMLFNKYKRCLKKIYFFTDYFRRVRPDAAVVFLEAMEIPVILAGILTHTKIVTSIRDADISTKRSTMLFRRIFYPHIAGVVFQNHFMMQKKEYQKTNKPHVILNPLSKETYFDVPPVSFQDRKKWIIHTGRLTQVKNQRLLIDAFLLFWKSRPDYELHIFGEGELETELCGHIRRLGMEKHIFLDGVHKDVMKEHKDAMIYACTSRSEGFPNAIAEAMANGMIVVTTDFEPGTASEFIEHNKNGFIVPDDSPGAFAKTMECVIKMGEKTDQIAQEAIKIRGLLDLNRICEQWKAALNL